MSSPNQVQPYVPPAAPGAINVQPGSYPSVFQQPSSALSYLQYVDQLLIKQEIHLLDVVSDWTSNVRFAILNSQGQQVFKAEEESGCCNRNCCKSNRSFDLHIRDLNNFSVILLRRPLRCCGLLLPCCCLQEMTIESPPGNTIGYIRENWNIFTPTFTIYDAANTALFDITGDCCPSCTLCYCGRDINFDVKDRGTGQPVGRVAKNWGGLLQETFTNATNFSVTFNMAMPIEHKAILLSVSFLFNFMFFEFERNTNNNSSSRNN